MTTEYAIHPAAGLMPEMTETEFKELVEDIRAKGLLQAIELLNDMIIDGRNRLRACREAGVEPRFTVINLPKLSAVEYVISKNLRRRHLTEGQRQAIAAEAVILSKGERKQQRDEKGHFTTVPPIGGAVKERHRRNRQGSLAAIAAQLGVSARNVGRAVRVLENAPDVFQELKAGKITTNAAEQTVFVREANRTGKIPQNPPQATPPEPEKKPLKLRAPDRECLACEAQLDFYKDLRREITRRRETNRDERQKRRWNPEYVVTRFQTELLDWIEEQLDLVQDAHRKSRPRANHQPSNGKDRTHV
jgi:ParB-like chromosome segregation protein Spo0J